MAPTHNIISNLVYAANAADVDTVIAEGKVIMLRGRVLALDIDRIRTDLARIAAQLAAENPSAAQSSR